MHHNEIVVAAEDFDGSKLTFTPARNGRNAYAITYSGKKLVLKGSSDLQLVERRLAQNCVSHGNKYFTYHQTNTPLLNALNAISNQTSALYGVGFIDPVKEGIFKAESVDAKNPDSFNYPPVWKVKSCLQIGKKFHIKYVNVREKILHRATPLLLAPEVKDEQLCVICLEREKEYAAIPCGHMCLCAGCSDVVRSSGRCPLCVAEIAGIYKIYR